MGGGRDDAGQRNRPQFRSADLSPARRRGSYRSGDVKVTSAAPTIRGDFSWRAIATVAARNAAQLWRIKGMTHAIMGHTRPRREEESACQGLGFEISPKRIVGMSPHPTHARFLSRKQITDSEPGGGYFFSGLGTNMSWSRSQLYLLRSTFCSLAAALHSASICACSCLMALVA